MKEIIDIKGMHCRSCEVLIEDKVRQIVAVDKVNADNKKGAVTIYSENGVSRDELTAAVQAAGYEVGNDDLPLVKLTRKDLLYIGFSLAILAILYYSAAKLGLARFLSIGGSNGALVNPAVVFTIGVTAGISSCMALVGGLVLGTSARYAERHPGATPIQKFRPHLFFNLGRIIAFFILGGIIGELGSFFRISSSLTGYFTITVGLFMLLLGIQLLEIFPRFNFGLTLPKGVSKALGLNQVNGAEYSHRNSMILGALTFFLPCGFTQAMQIYAVSTGSFVTGAMIMGIFALGTTPGLLGVGGLTSVLKKKNASSFFYKFVGVLVIMLSLYNLSNGLNLSGLRTYFQTTPQSEGVPSVETVGEVQLAEATYDQENVVTPKKFTFKVGVPVRIEIFAKEDGSGCMGSIMIPRLVNEPQFFVKDKTAVLEFTPKNVGKYTLTCAMGVPAGQIEIVN